MVQKQKQKQKRKRKKCKIKERKKEKRAKEKEPLFLNMDLYRTIIFFRMTRLSSKNGDLIENNDFLPNMGIL